ncbi:MAG: hypothetical protein WA137_00220 [Methanothrix sp.]
MNTVGAIRALSSDRFLFKMNTLQLAARVRRRCFTLVEFFVVTPLRLAQFFLSSRVSYAIRSRG